VSRAEMSSNSELHRNILFTIELQCLACRRII